MNCRADQSLICKNHSVFLSPVKGDWSNSAKSGIWWSWRSLKTGECKDPKGYQKKNTCMSMQNVWFRSALRTCKTKYLVISLWASWAAPCHRKYRSEQMRHAYIKSAGDCILRQDTPGQATIESAVLVLSLSLSLYIYIYYIYIYVYTGYINKFMYKILMWGLAKIPFRFWYDWTPCASPLRALAPVRVSAYPIHRMQNCKDFCILQSKSCFLYKPQQKCEELCGLALRCHWRKRYYQTQIYEESFFVGNPFWRTWLYWGNVPWHHFSCACLARILRQRLFRSD